MSDKRIRVKRITIKAPNEFNCNSVDVDAYYSLGGMNYWTSRVEPRGYYVSIQPINVDGYCTQFMAFTGIKYFMKEAARFSQKVMNEVAGDPIIERYVNDFMQQHGLETKE